jgi:hypothetical protein
LFFDKKDLTNGIDWFISCAMNANEMTPKTNARLNRIQKVSKYLRLILQYGIPTVLLLCLVHVTIVNHGGNPFSEVIDRNVIWTQHDHNIIYPVYSCLFLIVFFFWYRTVIKLFSFFEKGILFSAETVRCIQFLGGIYFVRFFLELICQFLLQNQVLIRPRMSDLFTGFFIFFIGWLIDEARKIREEQELTV